MKHTYTVALHSINVEEKKKKNNKKGSLNEMKKGLLPTVLITMYIQVVLWFFYYFYVFLNIYILFCCEYVYIILFYIWVPYSKLQ